MAKRKAKKQVLFDENVLTGGEVRKLMALRKSLGDDIANRAFSEWLETREIEPNGADPNASMVAEALHPFIESKELKIPKQGSGRLIVTAVEQPA